MIESRPLHAIARDIRADWKPVNYAAVPYLDAMGSRTIASGLTLEQAQAHCSDINTSSATAWTTSALKRTKRYGPWFDSYSECSR